MYIIPLGAGQDVGRSCIIVTIQGKTIMLDCGMHMGYNDSRKFPDFTYLTKNGNFNKLIDCIIISHFHIDHCGALPYFTEVIGYDGPIYMTPPTQAICKILLEDMRKISLKNNDRLIFTSQDIKNCMKKVIQINMNETYNHDINFTLKAYPAGHVLGAAMFYVKVNDESFVYTGDFNMTPDRHLSSAYLDCLQPDLLITESTYGSTVRDCRRTKEREFLTSVHNCIKNGGKVLIPTFALGRAQEICLILDSYWARMNLKVPVYYSTGMTEKANEIYRLYIGYTNETIRKKITENNLFKYRHVMPMKGDHTYKEGPMVILASPGMLHSGSSLQIFLKICHEKKNLIIIPGYCVRGTVGDKVLKGEKVIKVNSRKYDVNLQLKNLAFSAHADAKGIMQLIDQCKPRKVMLVHGDRDCMISLKNRIYKETGIETFMPPNGTHIHIPENNNINFLIKKDILEQIISNNEADKKANLLIKFKEIKHNDQKKYEITSAKNYLIDKSTNKNK